MLVTPEMKAAFTRTVEEWAVKYTNQNIKRLERKQGTGELSRSMRLQIERHSEGEVRELMFYFQTHGRFLDMRNVNAGNGGKEYIDNLVAWMHNKGIVNDMISKWWGFHQSKEIPADVERRIAWGIIKSHVKKTKRWKWYNSSKQAALNELNTRIMLALTQPMLTDISSLLAARRPTAFGKAYNKAHGR